MPLPGLDSISNHHPVAGTTSPWSNAFQATDLPEADHSSAFKSPDVTTPRVFLFPAGRPRLTLRA
ncbi:MAG: hypothetical protein EA425_00830 [Puniceicoccaceae bacterium]|nr:MAG: hypothetical protein EA425_00830 [Puniceicoccaceae bacterium]